MLIKITIKIISFFFFYLTIDSCTYIGKVQYIVEGHRLMAQAACGGCLKIPFISRETLGKLVNLSRPQGSSTVKEGT